MAEAAPAVEATGAVPVCPLAGVCSFTPAGKGGCLLGLWRQPWRAVRNSRTVSAARHFTPSELGFLVYTWNCTADNCPCRRLPFSSVETFDIEVTRDGEWWRITVPGLDGYVRSDGSTNVSDTTQARHEGEIDAMARDFIATVLDVAVESVGVRRS